VLGRIFTRVATGSNTPTLAEGGGGQAVSFLTATPPAQDARAAMAANPRVRDDVVVAGEGSGTPAAVLAVVAAGGLTAGNSSTPQAHSAAAAFSVSLDGLAAPQHLVVGLLDPSVVGNGFDQLRFRVTREGVDVVDQTFASGAAAAAYFDDRPLDLGLIGTDVVDTLDLEFHLDVTTTSASDGFAARFLVANATPGSGARFRAGDANGDGSVNFADLVSLAQHYNAVDGQRTWAEGDFTWDGKVNFADLVALAQHYNTAAADIVPASIASDFVAAQAAAVPEPTGLSLCALAAAGTLLRRRRRRCA
jgi:hypothetical protein